MGLCGAKEGDNHGCMGVQVKHGDHKIMDPNKLGFNGVHNGPMGLLEAPLDAIYASTTKLEFQFWPMVAWAILIEPKFCNAISPRCPVASCCSSVTRG